MMRLNQQYHDHRQFRPTAFQSNKPALYFARPRKRRRQALTTVLGHANGSTATPQRLSLSQRLTEIETTQLNPLLDALYLQGESFFQQQVALAETNQPPAERSPTEQKINRNLTESVAVAILNSVGAIVYPPLMWLSVPFLLRRWHCVFQAARNEVAEESKIGFSVMVTLGETSLLLLRKFWVSALFDAIYMCSEKILFTIRDTSTHNLLNVLGETPSRVWCLEDGVEVEVAVDQLTIGDCVVAHAGEMVPVDGEIVSGFATLDEQMLTGEAQPAEKIVGDTVYAGTVVLSGILTIAVEKAGSATVAGQIGEILNQTADYRSMIELQGEKIADASVVPTLALSAATLAVLGPVSATALMSCFVGFQLRYTSPLAVLNFLQIAAQERILIKDGRALEALSKVDAVVFDKTGTLTLAQLSVGNIAACGEYTERDVLRYAAAAEQKQAHPIAHAIRQMAQQQQLDGLDIFDASMTTGFGLDVCVADAQDAKTWVRVGSERHIRQKQIEIPAEMQTKAAAYQAQGCSVVYVALDDQLAGIIELCPTIRPEAEAVVAALKARDITPYIISGDQALPTRNLAEQLGIEQYYAQVLPQDKAAFVTELQQAGRTVCFVGDGINDAIALKQADVSVSLSNATQVANETAQIILTDDTLTQLPMLFTFADDLQANMRGNLMAGTVPGLICIGGVFFLNFGVLAAGVLSWTGLTLGVANAMRPLVRYRNQRTLPEQ